MDYSTKVNLLLAHTLKYFEIVNRHSSTRVAPHRFSAFLALLIRAVCSKRTISCGVFHILWNRM